MSEPHSTAPSGPDKPVKPHPDFPLFPHATRRWAKKIRGKMHYFGPWSDPDAALKKYLEQKDALHAGRKPREDTEGLTVKALVNHFLIAKQNRVDSGELSAHTWTDYKRACDLLISNFGKTRLVADLGPDDFAGLRKKLTQSKSYGVYRLGNTIQDVRCVFKHGFDSGLIDRPVRFGPGFARPTKKTLRLHRARQGPKLFTAEEIRRLLDAAGPVLKAMLLLGVNCGFGNADCGQLPLSALDLVGGWVEFPRPKTGIARRCPLWPETVEAVKGALAKRPEPKQTEHAGLVFITKYGGTWAKEKDTCPVSAEMGKLLRKLSINGRKGLNFYTLRHVFRTVADEAKDQPAADFIMGHESPHMSAVYRETISDARLKAVSDYVRKWLFGDQPAKPPSVTSSSGDADPASPLPG